MSLKIRLSRGGTKKRPFYRVVVADSRSPRDGRFIERIGSYNPMLKKDNPDRFIINEERAKHWLSVGAQPSDRVARQLSTSGIVEKPAIPEQTKKDKPRAKTLERIKEREEKVAIAKEQSSVEEAPAEEPAADEVPSEKGAAKDTSTEEAAADEAPSEEGAAKDTSTEEAIVEQTVEKEDG